MNAPGCYVESIASSALLVEWEVFLTCFGISSSFFCLDGGVLPTTKPRQFSQTFPVCLASSISGRHQY